MIVMSLVSQSRYIWLTVRVGCLVPSFGINTFQLHCVTCVSSRIFIECENMEPIKAHNAFKYMCVVYA